ncbi:hypothetical protein CR513_31604, partial [Mucuna pruriens]
MILVEVGEPTLKRSQFNLEDNSDAFWEDHDLVKEAREQACTSDKPTWSGGRRETLGRKVERASSQPIGNDHLESKNHSAMTHAGLEKLDGRNSSVETCPLETAARNL